MMTDFLMLGHEGIGSYALSSDKTTMFGNAIGTYLDILTSCLNKQAVPSLFALNALDITRLPKISHGEINDADLVKLAAIITALSTAGLVGTPDPTFINWLRDQFGGPHIDPNMPLAPPTAPPSGPNGNSPRQAVSAGQTGSPVPNNVPKTPAVPVGHAAGVAQPAATNPAYSSYETGPNAYSNYGGNGNGR